MSNWTYRQLPAGKPIDWNRRTMAVKALGEIGRPASNAIPALIFAITNCESGAVDPARGDRYGQLRHQSGFIDVAALEALPKVGPDSRPALHALTNLLAQRPQEIAHRSAAALRALSLVTPPRGEIPGIIEVLRRREAYYWKSAFHSVSRTDLESYLGLIGRIKSTAGNNGNETLESMAYGFGTATNLSASDRKTLAAALIPLHQHLGGQPLFLLLESIVILDPAAGQQIFAYLINQTEFQQFDLRLRALESLRRMGSLAAIRFEGREGVAAQSVTRCLKDEVPIVRLWAEETLKAITGSNVVLTAK
jgi:HEAT repeat protein